MLQKIKSYMMPIAMATGIIFHKYVSVLSSYTPILIATMLFITYCSVSLKDIRFSKLFVWLLLIQIGGALTLYYLISPFNDILGQSALICVLAPTATSAPIITRMLGGNATMVATYSLLSNMILVIAAPLIFASIGEVGGPSFVESALIVGEKVFFLLLLPFFVANILKKVWKRAHKAVSEAQNVSFYLWSVALCVITGKTVVFITTQNDPNYWFEGLMATIAACICIAQFIAGRFLGKKFNETIAGGQSLGQKNTILAIWMAQLYLNPISSIAPSAYILWQNIINSYQVWLKRKSL